MEVGIVDGITIRIPGADVEEIARLLPLTGDVPQTDGVLLTGGEAVASNNVLLGVTALTSSYDDLFIPRPVVEMILAAYDGDGVAVQRTGDACSIVGEDGAKLGGWVTHIKYSDWRKALVHSAEHSVTLDGSILASKLGWLGSVNGYGPCIDLSVDAGLVTLTRPRDDDKIIRADMCSIRHTGTPPQVRLDMRYLLAGLLYLGLPTTLTIEITGEKSQVQMVNGTRRFVLMPIDPSNARQNCECADGWT